MKLDKLILKDFLELEKEAGELNNLRFTKPGATKGGQPVIAVPYDKFKGWGTRV
jgi:hypothetical protein